MSIMREQKDGKYTFVTEYHPLSLTVHELYARLFGRS